MAHWLGSFESLISSSFASAAPAKRAATGATIHNRDNLIAFSSLPLVDGVLVTPYCPPHCPKEHGGGAENPAAGADRFPLVNNAISLRFFPQDAPPLKMG